MVHDPSLDVHDSPDSSAGDNDSAKRMNGSSDENVPFMDSEGKFGKRYKVHKVGSATNELQELKETAAVLLGRGKKGLDRARRTYDFLDWVTFFLPFMGWLRTYKVKKFLLDDILAGLSVAALVVPQGMSYARLAGLPSVYGLYGAFVPVLCYAALGSSRQLAVGPVAVTSLLLGSGIPGIIDAPVQDDPNNPHNKHAQDVYNHAAIQVAFLAGCLYTFVGLFRLGWLTNFLSHSVIAGFMSGASVIIALSQVKLIFGYSRRPDPASTDILKLPPISFPRHDPVHLQLQDLLGPTWTPYFKWREFVMGISWLIILFTMKELGKRNKKLVYVRAAGPLTVTVLSIAISNIFKLYKAPSNIAIVGSIPQGLPHQTVTWWFPMPEFKRQIGLAIIVCLIDVLESISIAKALAYRNQYDLNSTQELRGLGLANLVGAAFNCYTTTGSFSRSAVMNDVGAKTQLAGVTSGLLVMIVLLCLTPVFRNMPQNAQGAVIIAAVIGLFNYSEWWFLWKVNKLDWLVMNVALFCTMFAGVDIGLGVSIGVSIFLALYKTAFPKTALLGRLPETTVFRNVKQYPEARQVEGLLLLRIDAPLFFANVIPVKEALVKYEARAAEAAAAKGRPPLQFIIIDLSPVTDIDASAVHFLTEWISSHKKRGIQPVISNPSRQVMHLLEKAGIPELIGEEYITVRMNDAVLLCQEVLAELGAHRTSVAEQLERESIKDRSNKPEASFSVTQKL